MALVVLRNLHTIHPIPHWFPFLHWCCSSFHSSFISIPVNLFLHWFPFHPLVLDWSSIGFHSSIHWILCCNVAMLDVMFILHFIPVDCHCCCCCCWMTIHSIRSDPIRSDVCPLVYCWSVHFTFTTVDMRVFIISDFFCFLELNLTLTWRWMMDGNKWWEWSVRRFLP